MVRTWLVRRALLVLAVAAGCGITTLHVTQKAQLAYSDGGDVAAPAFSLTAHTGQTVALADGLAAGHVVLVFYRGHW